MSVARRLLLIMLVVALVPVGLSVVTALPQHEHALAQTLAALHHRTAESGARATELWLVGARRTIGALAGNVPWAALSPAERQGALVLVFEQLDDIAVVTLLDEHGQGLGPAVVATDPADRHPVASVELLTRFGAVIPMATARATGFAIGDLVGAPTPVVPMAFAVDGPAGAQWTLGVALSLATPCRDLAAASPPGVTSWLLARGTQRLCGPGAGPRRSSDELTAAAGLDGGWSVVVEQPVAKAMASRTRMRRQSLFWVGLGLMAAAAAGLLMTRTIRRPLAALSASAGAVAAGDLAHRVPDLGGDEFGAVAHAFNHMSAELERTNAEIVGWNQELRRRIDERTADLVAAQDQLLQSRKLGALAVLGAGVAHEINNPLAAVLGMTQLALADAAGDPDRTAMLETVEREALRIRDIVARMQSLDGDYPTTATRGLNLAAILDRAVAGLREQLTTAIIAVRRDYQLDAPTIDGDGEQLEQAFHQLIDNSVKAMTPGGGTLTLTIRSIEGEMVSVTIGDTGRGIAPELHAQIFEPFFTTKHEWHGRGLGLAVTHRIIETHLGRIRFTSAPGRGTTMTITVPATRRGVHLA